MERLNNNRSNKECRKFYIPIDGELYETNEEIYKAYYKMDRRERYLEERDIKKGVMNFVLWIKVNVEQ